VLVALMAVGVAIRHYFNRRHAGQTLWWIPVGCALAIAAIAIWLRPHSTKPAPGTGTVSFTQAQRVVQNRCAPCHSLHPTQPGFSSAPMGVVLDTPEQIHQLAAQIKGVAVDSTFMPLGNATNDPGRARPARAVARPGCKDQVAEDLGRRPRAHRPLGGGALSATVAFVKTMLPTTAS
jgi:uncharacterized membrane protein